MKTDILNFTPHTICIFHADSVTYNSAIRKWIVKDGAEPFLIIKSSGMLNARIDTIPSTPVNGIPTFIKKVTGCDPLPTGDSLVIVSALFAAAAVQVGHDMSRIFTIADPVFTPDGRTVLGCLGICPAI